MASIAQSAVLVHSGAEIDITAFDHRPGGGGSGPAGASPGGDKGSKPAALRAVGGPKGADLANMEALLACYPTLGFQGSHFGQAVELGKKMITKQPPSTLFTIQDGQFVKVEEVAATQDGDEEEDKSIFPTLFMGITATLMGTGCREAVRFLVQEGAAPREAEAEKNLSTNESNFPQLKAHFGDYAAERLSVVRGNESGAGRFAPVGDHKSFLSALVMSGGGPEHDLRRSCQPYYVAHYASETPAPPPAQRRRGGNGAEASVPAEKAAGPRADDLARFGNVLYAADTATPTPTAVKPAAAHTALFDAVMGKLAVLLQSREAHLRAVHAGKPEQQRRDAVADGTAYCSWSVTPSEVWALAGLWLEDVLVSALAEIAAAKQAKRRPKKAAQKAQTDAADEVKEEAVAAAVAKTVVNVESFRAEARERAHGTVLYWAARQEVPIYCPSFADGDLARLMYTRAAKAAAAGGGPLPMLTVDLVRDIHGLNRTAMYSKRTGMLLCGGGSVKHHVCNANLMRNGADYTVFISNGQEFDGSDGGARPEEAISWGKIRCDGEAVKVYSEVTVVLPLLVAQVFVPAVRDRDAATAPK